MRLLATLIIATAAGLFGPDLGTRLENWTASAPQRSVTDEPSHSTPDRVHGGIGP